MKREHAVEEGGRGSFLTKSPSYYKEEGGAFNFLGFHFSLGIERARAIKIYKATVLDDAHFIIGALRVFF